MTTSEEMHHQQHHHHVPVHGESEMVHHQHQHHGSEPAPMAVKKRGSWRNTIIIIILIISIMAILYYHVYSKEKQEAREEKAEVEKERAVDKAMNYARMMLGMEVMKKSKAVVPVVTGGMHSTQSENTRAVVTENSDSMLKLAIGLRDSGMKLKGVSQCRFTQIQREAFGGRDSEARKVIESIYTECRSRDMCPNIRGYPTWTLNDRQWPGNRSANALRAMLSEAKTTNMKSMLQGPSEPVIEMVPDAQHAEQTGDEELSAEAAVALLNQIKTKDESDEYGDAVGEIESGKIANVAASAGVVIPVPEIESKKLGGFDAAANGGTMPFVMGGFVADTVTTSPPMGVKKENVRGVSNFAPLNVPDMPGTAPFVLRQEQHDDQTRQGNAPRASSENHMATVGVAGQHIAGFLQEETHVSTRNINADSYSLKRFPHASDITTGEAFADKTIVYEKN